MRMMIMVFVTVIEETIPISFNERRSKISSFFISTTP